MENYNKSDDIVQTIWYATLNLLSPDTEKQEVNFPIYVKATKTIAIPIKELLLYCIMCVYSNIMLCLIGPYKNTQCVM